MRSLSPDDRLVTSLLAAPDLHDGVESLDYWRRRARRLPWYRVGARREAREMVQRWEGRVAAAIFSPQRVPLRLRFSAVALVTGARIERIRWRRFAVIGALTATAVVVVPLALTALLLAQLF